MKEIGTITKQMCLCILIFCTASLFGSEPPKTFHTSIKRPKSPVVRTRFTMSPVISFYKVNQHHAKNPTQKMSGLFSLKEEIRLNNKHNAFLLIGAEYFVHGLNFNSYYFKQDSIQLYTGSFDYTYSMYIHEIDFPIQLKLSFSRENNSVWSGYWMFGYHFRELITGKLKVKQNGEIVEKKSVDVLFKNPLFTARNNPFVSMTLGVQKNNPNNTRSCVYAELSYRMGFSPYYIKDSFAPSSLYITSNHLSFGLGVKF